MKNILKKYLPVILELSKVKITIMVAITTIAGYILAKRSFDLTAFYTSLGIFLLACGSSVINQLQERRTDNFMERTQKRPLPREIVSLKFALGLIIIEIILGILILSVFVGLIPTLLGIVALIWYNAIYTPIKKITPHAVIPGSVIGAIPPLAGWTAANGSLLSPQAWLIALFFFVWQVPHFYLLAYKYSSQYKSAGFPVITDIYSSKSFRILVYIWIIATSVASIVLFIGGLINSFPSILILIFSLVWLNVVFFKPIIKLEIEYQPGKYFMKINYFVLLVIILLLIDHLIP